MRALVVSFVMCLGLAVGSVAPAVAAPPEPQAESQEAYRGGRSSFWGSNKPAKGGAYRWRLLGIGVVLLGGTGLLMLRMIRRASEERARSSQLTPR